jgi:hypothetical protein
MTATDVLFDLGGRDALGLNVSALAGDVLARIPVLSERIDNLVAVRESSVGDHVLMEGCQQHTLSYCTSVPGCARALGLGLDPLLRPELVPNDVPVIELHHRGTKAVLFVVDGTGFLYSEASAAAVDAKGDNHWTSILVAVLERWRPRRLHVVSLSRLVRSFELCGLVQSAASRHVDVVIAGGRSITMRGEGQETGQLMWSVFAMLSASERNLIIQRLSAGVVAMYRRGEWVRGKGSQPIGYPYDPTTKNLVLDSDCKRLVELAWILCADEKLTDTQIVMRLGDAGITTPGLLRRHGPSATVADLTSARNFIDHMLRYADLYRTGRHIQRLMNPFPGATHLSTLPVLEPTDKYQHGYVEFVYDWGMPPGGWVDEEIIHAALKARARGDKQGSRLYGEVGPLNGFTWVSGGFEYMVFSGDSETYEIRVSPVGAER